MKSVLAILLPLIVVLGACQPIVAPEGMIATEEVAAAESSVTEPMVDINFYTSHAGHEHFGKIDLASGTGTDVGKYENPEVEILRVAWAAANGALYEDAFYVILNKRLPADATPDEAQARLARVDMQTGAAELLGSIIPLNLMALEISPCGEMFSTGFTFTSPLGEWFGDTDLYRVDRQDGSITLIGDTGLERIMDMSFDPDGKLWATVGNVLYTLDIETGAATEMTPITGVEDDNEIMGLGFTDEGTLYATTPFSDGFYTIDMTTGAVTEVGRHGFTIPHGGDIPMALHDVHCEGVTE